MQTIFDVTFSSFDGEPLKFDYFPPTHGTPASLVVCIHGGGWISGEKEGMREVALAFQRRGFAAACPEYRLAPLHCFPDQVRDIESFIKHIRPRAAELGFKGTAIVSLGNSAGGHLSCMAALSKDPASRTDGCVAICPITDLNKPVEKHFPIAWSFLDQFMGVPFEGNEQTFSQASPVDQIFNAAPPFLIFHGTDDDIVPVSQSDVLAERLSSMGVPVELHHLMGETHSISYESWLKIEERASQFIKKIGESA